MNTNHSSLLNQEALFKINLALIITNRYLVIINLKNKMKVLKFNFNNYYNKFKNNNN